MNNKLGGLFLFFFKFLVFLLPLVWLWWHFALPWYGELLVQCAGGILKYAFGMGILAGEVVPKGFLNTESMLVFVMVDHEPAMPIAKLISNTPPYLALVLATPALAFWKRIRIMLYGVGILAVCHMGFIVFAMRIQEHQVDYQKVPTALGQFLLTLPFLLWIIFAQWDKITQGVSNSRPLPVSESAENSTE